MHDVVVLGSGRSGTSLTMGVLAKAGHFMGYTFADPDIANPKGRFEDHKVNRINEALLAPLMPGRPREPFGRWLTPGRLADGWRWLADVPLDARIRTTPALDREMVEVAANRPLALKDPRMSYTLPAWRPHLGPDLHHVVVFRHPGSTAESMVKEARRIYPGLAFDHARGLRVWTQSYRHILERHHAQGGAWLFVHYDQFFGDGEAYPRIARFLGTPPDTSFADSTLRRSEPPAGLTLPEDTLRTYERLCSLAGHTDARAPLLSTPTPG